MTTLFGILLFSLYIYKTFPFKNVIFLYATRNIEKRPITKYTRTRTNYLRKNLLIDYFYPKRKCTNMKKNLSSNK